MEPQTETSSAPESDRLVPVISYEARHLHLQAYGERSKQEQAVLDRMRAGGREANAPQPIDTVTILPGLNYVRASMLKRVNTDLHRLNVKVAIKNPTALHRFEKHELITNTTSRISLTYWRTAEDDAEIAKMIDERLARVKPRAA